MFLVQPWTVGWEGGASWSILQCVRATMEGGLLAPQALYPVFSSHREPLDDLLGIGGSGVEGLSEIIGPEKHDL